MGEGPGLEQLLLSLGDSLPPETWLLSVLQATAMQHLPDSLNLATRVLLALRKGGAVCKENSGSWGFGRTQDSKSPFQTLRVQPSSQNCVTEATAVLGVSQDWGPVPPIPAPRSDGQAAERGRTGRQFPCCQKEFFHWLERTRS